MKYISSANDFFSQPVRATTLQPLVPINIWETIGSLTLTQYVPASIQEASAKLAHQLYLLEAFDTIE